MKTIRHNLALLLFLLPCLAFAGDGVKGGKYTKEKKIAKAYIVNSNCALDVNNQFGSIYVTTWDEDKTQIEVLIKVSGNNEDKVDRRLSSIEIDINATKSLVEAHTRIGNMGGSSNLSMEINYTIKIPKKGAIDLKNQYGSIITGKIYGKANIDCQYGDVNVDELNTDNNNINLQYSNNSSINYLKSGDIHSQYSTLRLTKTGNLKFRGEYAPTKLGEVNNLTYNNDYSHMTVESVGNVSGSGDYSNITFGYVSGNFSTTSNYGNVKVAGMSKNGKNISINSSYSDITVNYNESVSFDFEFNLEYGNLRGTSGLKFTEKSDRDNSAHYKGYYRTQGVNRMYIRSEYGNINLGK